MFPDLDRIEEHYLQRFWDPPRKLLQQLEGDSRARAQRLLRSLRKRRDELRTERRRIRDLQKLETELREKRGHRFVAGIDEVGVGTLAGPLVAAAVVFPPNTLIYGVDDSKRLADGRRRQLSELIQQRALAVGIGVASVVEIDDLNVYHAGILAMARAVRALSPEPDFLLVDARLIPDIQIPQMAIPAGDRKHFSIGAASILAKVLRDDIMTDLGREYPRYGFSAHKGYATQAHRQAIRSNGPCAAHRLSYAAVRQLAQPLSEEMELWISTIRRARTSTEIDGLVQRVSDPGLGFADWEISWLLLESRRQAARLLESPQLSLF